MVRPHSKNFYYNAEDFEQMKSIINTFKDHGADGFVFGILHDESATGTRGWVDVAHNKALVELADGRPCTFHRAFDLIPYSEWDNALAEIAKCGFTFILTSGGPSSNSAAECTDLLKSLIHDHLSSSKFPERTRDQLPQIIVGGGLRSTNIMDIIRGTWPMAVHSAALTQKGELVDGDEVRALRLGLDRATQSYP